MKTIAIICEYNPFHAGHLRQISLVREIFGEDAVILSLMSGNYVQRGEMALYPKYTRARSALACGVDLVLELPYPWSCGSAAFFARGAVSVLCDLGCVDHLVFGCEDRTLPELEQYIRRTASPEFAARLDARRDGREGSMSDIRLVSETYRSLYGEDVPTRANDILAAEYLRALYGMRQSKDPKCAVSPYAIRREGPWSATAIRQSLRRGDDPSDAIPSGALQVLQSAAMPDLSAASAAALGYFRLTPPSVYVNCDGAGGGMAHRIARQAMQCTSLERLYTALRCKTSTDAAIRRTVWHCLFGTERDDLRNCPAFVTVLAASASGMQLLHRARRTSRIPVLTRPAAWRNLDGYARRQGEQSARADAFYALAMGWESGHDLREKPVLLS